MVRTQGAFPTLLGMRGYPKLLIKAGFCRILKSRILKDVGFQWNPTDIPTNSNGFHRIPTDPNGFHRKKYEKVGKCWKKSEIYDPTFYDPTLAFSDPHWFRVLLSKPHAGSDTLYGL